LHSLERNYKYELLTEHDLGVAIDLILPETYEVDLDVSDKLDPADEKLLEEELNTAQDKRRNMKHSQVGFLLDTGTCEECCGSDF
jgi:Paf1